MSDESRDSAGVSSVEERHRLVLDHAPVAIAMVDLEGRVVDANAATERLTGLGRDELLGSEIGSLTHPDDMERELPLLAQLLAGERDSYTLEKRYVRPDGTECWARLTATLIRTDDGSPRWVLGTAEDIDAERRARDELARKDAQLRQAQKMESLGRLAGGVAHDFNNLLTAISGYSELGAASDDPAEMKDALTSVGEVAEHAAALTRQLLAFSRGQRVAPVDVDLNELVRSMRTALEMLVGDNVELRLDLAAHVDSVNIDPTAAQQTVLNLVVNARDAMPGGGTLTIGTENDHDELLLTVSDEGVGMSGDTLARAFDPFFTTKESGHGLGLSAVLGLVEQAGGDVQVTSAPNAGTTFELRLPTSGGHTAGVDGGEPRRLPAGEPAETERTVLVVEDTPFVRNLVVSYLESCGWRVLTATNGRDALSVAAAEPVDVVLTDAVMPEMGGYELTDRLHAIHSDLPVLVMSGYAHAPPAEPPRGAAFIQKPFVLAELQAMIDELLARRDGT